MNSMVILHGWSDSSESFRGIGTALHSDTVNIFLGNYVSLDDDVTIADLAKGLDAVWTAKNISRAPRSVDVVVHSTGGLIIREWMSRFEAGKNPVHRLLMLAPANFGSPIAHVGRSMLGRVLKGFHFDKPLQTGEKILKALELASPFSWELAERDRLDHAASVYGPGKVLATVLVGTTGYSGIRAAANKAGSDGTVYVSTANLNCGRLRLDFAQDPQAPKLDFVSDDGSGQVAFGRIAGENHSGIVSALDAPPRAVTEKFIRRALSVTDETFQAHVDDLKLFSEEQRKLGENEVYTHAFQNTVIRVRDEFGSHVTDYFLELFAKDDQGNVDDELTGFLQTHITESVHVYGDDASYRSLLINTTELGQRLTARDRSLFISLSAMPDIHSTGSVGYSTLAFDAIGSIRITPDEQKRIFQPDRTLLVDLILRREQSDKVMQLLEHPTR